MNNELLTLPEIIELKEKAEGEIYTILRNFHKQIKPFKIELSYSENEVFATGSGFVVSATDQQFSISIKL